MKAKIIQKTVKHGLNNDFRKDFPLIHNKGLAYLDNAATTQKPKIVIDALKDYYENNNANAHRGVYKLSEDATMMLEDSRKVFASFINAMPEEIIFTKSSTEGLNQLANSIEKTINIDAGHNIVTTEVEHHSNFLPWQQLCKRSGAKFRIAKYQKSRGCFEDIEGLVDEDTLIVAFTGMSNVNGMIIDVKSIIKDIRKKNDKAIIIIDGTQLAAHNRIDVKELDADFISFSAHKTYGTFGVGILYGKKNLLENIEPFFYGGNMISKVTVDEAEWAGIPDKFEAGTIDSAGIIASAEAIRYLEKNFDEIISIEDGLKSYLLSGLRRLSFIKIIGHDDKHDKNILGYGPVVSFIVDGVHPHDLASICDRHNVCIRAGHHCCQPFMDALKVNATARASISYYNTRDDVDLLIEAIIDAHKIIS